MDAAKEKFVVDGFIDWHFYRYVDDGEDISQKDFCSGSVLEWARTYDDEEEEEDYDDARPWGSFDPADLLCLAGDCGYTALGMAILDTDGRCPKDGRISTKRLCSALAAWLRSGTCEVALRLLDMLREVDLNASHLPGHAPTDFPEELGRGGSLELLEALQTLPPPNDQLLCAATVQSALNSACLKGNLRFVQAVVEQ